MALLRPHLPEGIWSATDLLDAKDRQRVLIVGNVICRQRPGTAKGFVFVSLEDETGIVNAIVAALSVCGILKRRRHVMTLAILR